MTLSLYILTYGALFLSGWRRGWDSNPRSACTDNGFQDRHHRPLGHPSIVNIIYPANWLASMFIILGSQHPVKAFGSGFLPFGRNRQDGFFLMINREIDYVAGEGVKSVTVAFSVFW